MKEGQGKKKNEDDGAPRKENLKTTRDSAGRRNRPDWSFFFFTALLGLSVSSSVSSTSNEAAEEISAWLDSLF